MVRLSAKELVRRHLAAALDAHEADDLHRAMVEINAALDLSRGRGHALWAAKSRFLYNLGKQAEAAEAAKKSIELNERNYHALVVLGYLAYDNHEFEEAAFYFKKVVEINETHGHYTELAAAERQFDPESAIEHAKMALKLNPDWDEAKAVLRNAEDDLKKK